MKRIILLIVFAAVYSLGMSQLVVKAKCEPFYVDVLDGKVNGLKASAPDYDVKKAQPCFTSAEAEGSSAKCGGGVFYKDKDIYFFTDRDYILIGNKFKGKLSIPLMGGARNSFFKYLGNPKLKDDTWDAFQMNYGTLVLHYDKAGKVNRIEISTRPTETLSLCE